MARTVLVADADTTTRELITSVLTREGFTVVNASDGAEAWSACEQDVPLLLLCAEQLSGVSGSELCRRAKERNAAVRTVLIADTESAVEALARQTSCDAAMARPFRFAALRQHLAEWHLLTERRREAEVEPRFSFSLPPVPEPFAGDLTVAAPETSGIDSGAGDAAVPIPVPVGLPLSRGSDSLIATAPAPPAPLELGEPPALAPPAPLDLGESATLAPPPPLNLGEPAALAPPPPLDQAGPGALAQALVVAPPRALDSAAAASASAGNDALAGVEFEFELDDDKAAPLSTQTPPPAVTEPEPPAVRSVAATATNTLKGVPAPAAALPAHLPRHGDLREVPLPRLVFELYLATFSGIVRLGRQGAKYNVYFWGGLPARVDGDALDADLGELLVEHGRITPAQHEQALAVAKHGNLSEGKALVEASVLGQADLLDAMRELTEQRLVRLFVWRDGVYSIDSDVSFADTVVLTEVHPVRCIFRGVCEHYDFPSLLTFFGPMRQRYVVASELFSVHYESLGPFLRYLDVTELLDGQTTFEAALRSDDARAMEVAQTLYVLLVTDMIRPAGKPGAAVALPKKTATRGTRTALIDYREITRLCDDIAREYLRVKESDFFQALGVAADAGPAEIDEAHARKAALVAPETLPAGLPEDSLRRAHELAALLGRARSVLRDPEQRQRYVARHD